MVAQVGLISECKVHKIFYHWIDLWILNFSMLSCYQAQDYYTGDAACV